MKIIELRSDTFTLPTPGMRDAMFSAPLGDDVFGEDPSILALEYKLANMFHKEAALFCPSGTMSNQMAISATVSKGQEVICDELSHIYLYEGGGIMANAGASVKLLKGDLGRLTKSQIEAAISPDDIHACESAMVSLENTVNKGGGSVYTSENLEEISSFCRAKAIPLHLDGARIFNAMAVTGQSPAQFGTWFDSISICLSKGLGAPVGSVLVGNAAFIKKAKRVRKRLGGGWRQAGMLAAAGIYALDHQVERLQEDHQRARTIAEICSTLDWVVMTIPVVTNIVIVKIQDGLNSTNKVAELAQKGIKCSPFGVDYIRFVTHLDFDDDDLNRFKKAIKA
ncbi:aminotransferase class I/II-fold pyridoxal phosphate-dependent enzyme [Aquirufa ecclesiirivi]|uniref:Aminotransferase class I/II-fold pyridoxal phosphate-dependent enzyme n=1 Tax=Aquirufa ecclesiirivi TaxID=2715124 RepID=A0ABT4JDZ8_9BACT|nr:GntG family PLP-dependent aldolase [Aquirufa ecclesiirivi]MCZ2474015.1 aminotransferase class I/II-fold pyridoxal phosphate-dependent enzyme [Aquirufa ecclesiirivi]